MIELCILAVVVFYTLFFSYAMKANREGLSHVNPVME
jgi:hypothetical protein